MTELTDLQKVQQSGHALARVKVQTPEICLAAVQQNGYVLEFVKVQTPELRMLLALVCGVVIQEAEHVSNA